MNKLLIVLLVVVLGYIPNNVYAEGYAGIRIDGIYYKFDGDNAIVVNNSRNIEVSYRGDIVIPSQVTYNEKTYNVTSIASDAFSFQNITSIIIPNTVTTIGSYAFWSCTHLTSITIPNSVTSIGQKAFYAGLTSIVSEIEKPFAINDCFDDDTYTNATLTVPKGTKAAYQSTEGWSNFANIVEASGSQGGEIGDVFQVDGINYMIEREIIVSVINSKSTYEGDIVIPEKVTYNGKKYYVKSIGNSAFKSCSNLTSIIIPNSVIRIEDYAFAYCNSLSTITIPNSVATIGKSAFRGCSGLTSIVIPNSVTNIDDDTFADCSGLTSITIPNSVSMIGPNGAFARCNSLSSIMVESGNSIFDSRDNCNAIIETSSNTLITGCKNTIIPNSVTSIGDYAFNGCSGLTTITIPNSVISLGTYAFVGCSGLTTITIPNSVTSFGSRVFYYCSGLKSIVSEIEKPSALDFCFDDDAYSIVELIVPKGTKAAYQATGGWKNFTNIVEAEGSEEIDEVEFTINGTTYQCSKSDNSAIVKSVDPNMTSVEIPVSVSYDGTTYKITGIDDHAFDGSAMAALIWDVEAALSSKAFNNANIGSNFLLYVKSESYAPSSVMNVIVDGSANNIVLSDDGGAFYCPQAFTAHAISYTHYYSMETGGEGKGWETIALPFNVQKINHSTRGEIVPFALFNASSSQKPFWLASFSGSSFKRASSIQANEPYIIAMPNSSSYQNDYILTGNVTFSAENTSVPKTPTFSGKFVPTFSTVSKSSKAFALNAVNRYVSATGNYDPGSRFISNLRDVRPFEAYISSSSSTRGVIEIDFDDDKTELNTILFSTDESREVTIYTIGGRKVGTSMQGRLDETIEQLPKGVYIVNGKKIVK